MGYETIFVSIFSCLYETSTRNLRTGWRFNHYKHKDVLSEMVFIVFLQDFLLIETILSQINKCSVVLSPLFVFRAKKRQKFSSAHQILQLTKFFFLMHSTCF